MPCRLGETTCVLRKDDICRSDTLDLAILLEDEKHILKLSDSEHFPDMHAVWNARSEIPGAILLALAEKSYSSLFQMLENAAHRQLKVVGLEQAADAEEKPSVNLELVSGEEHLLSFSISSSAGLIGQFGSLRYQDVSHVSIRETPLPAEKEYASFVIPATDIASMAPGDVLLLPEVGSVSGKIVVDGRFVVSETGVSPWQDDGLPRVVHGEPSAMTLGELFDLAGQEERQMTDVPPDNSPLRLVRSGAEIASGRFGHLAGQPAFFIDAATN